jgi:hypothetical protein
MQMYRIYIQCTEVVGDGQNMDSSHRPIFEVGVVKGGKKKRGYTIRHKRPRGGLTRREVSQSPLGISTNQEPVRSQQKANNTNDGARGCRVVALSQPAEQAHGLTPQ